MGPAAAAPPPTGAREGRATKHRTEKRLDRRRALLDVQVLAALLVGERPPGFPPRDLEEIIDVEGPYPNAFTARRGQLRAVHTEGHTRNLAPRASQTSCSAPVSTSNSLTAPSKLAVATRAPSGLKAASPTLPRPARTATRDPLFRSQIMPRPLSPAVRIREPVGSKSTDTGTPATETSNVIVRMGSPRSQSQILTRPSQDPLYVKTVVASRRPSGLNATSLTLESLFISQHANHAFRQEPRRDRVLTTGKERKKNPDPHSTFTPAGERRVRRGGPGSLWTRGFGSSRDRP